MVPVTEKTFEALAKLPIDNHGLSERSEEYRIFRRLRSFTPFRMTEKRLLQEALLAIAIKGVDGGNYPQGRKFLQIKTLAKVPSPVILRERRDRRIPSPREIREPSLRSG
jgi:hypothetical protein